MNEPTVSPCWLPVGENHAGARGESRCSTAAKDGSLAPSVRRHPCLELQWGGWATKICPETPPLELLAAVRAERQGFSWNGCRCQGTRGGGLAQLDLQVARVAADLDAGHCPPCCSEALADNRMPPAPLGQVCLAVGWQLLQVPVGARFSPPPRARIYYSSTGTSSSPSWTSSPSPVPPKLIDPLAPRRDTLRQFFSPSKPPLQDLQIPAE
ncbi:hypothetical protein Purlil1_7028 [Purpureocillium lilacinum]|uniref:Uncharacterized protein n=1 Tax=Purpureocillium lilacinum TaxID=33203 RepID=A0ABR0BWV4_PURLI|nr:hypothetical protein Purlil1_7028 [Purpureocillium lilacinum]